MLQEEEAEEGGIEMAPVRVCMCVCLLLVFPHDLIRDILNGIFGRRNGDGLGEQLLFPGERASDSRVHGGYLRGGMGSILGNEPLFLRFWHLIKTFSSRSMLIISNPDVRESDKNLDQSRTRTHPPCTRSPDADVVY